MKQLENTTSTDTAIKAVANNNNTQRVNSIELLTDTGEFVNRFLVEGMVKNCEYMISQRKKAIKVFEGDIDTEFRNNPEQPSDYVIDKAGNNIEMAEMNIEEWSDTRDVIVKQLKITYPDWTPTATKGSVSSDKRKQLIAAAKKRAAK